MILSLGVAPVRGSESPVRETLSWLSITDTVAGALGMTNLTPLSDGIILSNASHTLHLFACRRGATIDGVSVWLHLPPRDACSNDLHDVARVDFDSLLDPILLSTAAPPAQLRIMLDPGHGGDDTGARTAGSTLLEKNVTLDIARRTAAQLRAAGQQVWLTRTNDTYLTLSDRTVQAANHHAQVFVSIHANSAPSNPLATGTETYVLPAPGFAGTAENSQAVPDAFPGNGFDAANALLGFTVQRRCAPLTSMDRGLKRARYHVLRDAPCPAALVECGFLTSTNDVVLLASTTFREHFAIALAEGIRDFARLAPPPPTNLPSAPPCCTNATLGSQTHP